MLEPSFMKSLFHGVLAEATIFPYPEPTQSEGDNLHIMMDSVRKFCAANVDSKKIDREGSLPAETLRALKELGLFGLVIPQEFGGVGLIAGPLFAMGADVLGDLA